mmetsp:Transcript_12215/g.40510  ORF Transcript_12215/g.40510 Transcript_12215/m.40510 type:complete len:261 (+) Transcript_12215:34-816(+)
MKELQRPNLLTYPSTSYGLLPLPRRPAPSSLERAEVRHHVHSVLLLLEAREGHRGALDHLLWLGQEREHRLLSPGRVEARHRLGVLVRFVVRRLRADDAVEVGALLAGPALVASVTRGALRLEQGGSPRGVGRLCRRTRHRRRVFCRRLWSLVGRLLGLLLLLRLGRCWRRGGRLGLAILLVPLLRGMQPGLIVQLSEENLLAHPRLPRSDQGLGVLANTRGARGSRRDHTAHGRREMHLLAFASRGLRRDTDRSECPPA